MEMTSTVYLMVHSRTFNQYRYIGSVSLINDLRHAGLMGCLNLLNS